MTPTISTNDLTALPPNPFEDTLGEAFAGRLPELEWIADGLKTGARLLLQGATGMGKSTLINRATEWVEEHGLGHLFSTDASLPENKIAEQIHGWADRLDRILGTSVEPFFPSAIAGDRGNPVAGVPIVERSVRTQSVLEALQRLDRMAAHAAVPLGVCFDNFKRARSQEGSPLASDLDVAARELPHLGLLVATNEKTPALSAAFSSRQLGPIEPAVLARSIDRQVDLLHPGVKGMGEGCVSQGGPVTGSISQLAREAFEIVKRSGVAGVQAVDRAVESNMQKGAASFQQIWSRLSEAERTALIQVGKFTAGLATPGNISALANGTRSIASLVGKGLLGQLPNGVIYFVDTAFRNWTGQLSVHLDTSASLPAAGPKALEFKFGLSASATRGPAVQTR